MIAAIEADARETADWTGRPALDPRVLAALRTVRREAFVPPEIVEMAYQNRAQVIGHGQTISQPFIVALMTDLLGLRPDAVVLEVGTGSGYQTAVLAMLVRRVLSIEVIPELAERAAAVLAAEGCINVELRVGDGSIGWPEQAPFDAIIVTAAALAVPPALIEQLGAPGRMVIPLGAPRGEQELHVIEKDASRQVTQHRVLPVAFVPLTGGPDWGGSMQQTSESGC